MPLFVLAALPGNGRLDAALALAHEVGRRVLEIDLAAAASPETLLRDAGLLTRLVDAIPFVRGVEILGMPDTPTRRQIATRIEALAGLVLLATAPSGVPPALFRDREIALIAWPEPDAASRRLMWDAALAAAGGTAAPATLDGLAERFRLPGALIARAAHGAVMRGRLSGGEGAAMAPAILFRAAREQSGDALGSLATRIDRQVEWSDLVLPPPTLARLREVAAAIANRGTVQRSWGMGRLSLSPEGLAVLFQGVSGTGKTMAASAIASSLGLDLYRVELAGVVSKYIGETEKNLDGIFRAARRSNAMLLFDEADALFGRRSEVKDAHDRYANLEVAYLLQRMEDHDGPVILATNLAKNMDQAFARRLQYIVEFPRPDPVARERLWRQMLAAPLPCAADLDFSQLARTFELTGGEIRKTALEAAFMAAANGQIVTMAHLVAVSTGELQRQGKVMSVKTGAAVR